MANNLQLYKNSYATLVSTLTNKATPTASFEAFDLGSCKVVFNIAQSKDSEVLISKNSSLSSEISILTPALSGICEIYITEADTKDLDAGTYWYTMFVTDVLGKQHNTITDSLKLIDTVSK